VQQLEHGHLVADIEKGGRFVEYEGIASLGECTRKPDALKLTSRQRIHATVAQLDDAAAAIASSTARVSASVAACQMPRCGNRPSATYSATSNGNASSSR